MRSKIIIYHHLGLGDHIVCNGLVRHMAETYDILLLCKQHNLDNVRFMYRDNTNIETHPVSNDYEAERFCQQNSISSLRIGFAVGGLKFPDCYWDENFYRNAGLPFEYSWSKFYLSPNHIEPPAEDYIFIHNIDSTNTDRINYNFISTDKKKIFTDSSIPFFDYYHIIQNASEIHCIDSSFKHLIDRIPTKGNLFYHKLQFPKQYDTYNHKKDWIIV